MANIFCIYRHKYGYKYGFILVSFVRVIYYVKNKSFTREITVNANFVRRFFVKWIKNVKRDYLDDYKDISSTFKEILSYEKIEEFAGIINNVDFINCTKVFIDTLFDDETMDFEDILLHNMRCDLLERTISCYANIPDLPI